LLGVEDRTLTDCPKASGEIHLGPPCLSGLRFPGSSENQQLEASGRLGVDIPQTIHNPGNLVIVHGVMVLDGVDLGGLGEFML
jgi:hypothetical protein